MKLRTLVVKTLVPVLRRQSSLNANFDTNIALLEPKEKGLFQELCYGTLRYFFELEGISRELMEKPLKGKDTDVYAYILVGLYQLRHLRTPDHAVISETVESAKSRRKPWASKLVNAVLRSYVRQKDGEDLNDDGKNSGPSINEKIANKREAVYSHPYWFIKRVIDAWPKDWESILAANNQQPPIYLRNNVQRGTREEYLNTLKAEGISAESSVNSPQALRLNQATDVLALPGFKDGRVSVQDEVAQLATYLLDVQKGQRVLDACCAPGGKTCHILETETKLEELIAVDLEESRMQRTRENLARLGLNATLKVADLMALSRWWDGKAFDRILLDAPCSATGVIRRHPDIKLLRREDDLAKLAVIQKDLLTALWGTLKPGGILVYATCSVLPEENELIVHEFLKNQDDASALKVGEDLPIGVEQTIGRQFFPQINGHDGFYYARLLKA